MSNIKIFAIHFSHFFIGNVSTLIFGFITFPVLTRVLTEDQYGIMGLVTNTAAFAVIFAKAGLSDGIIRIYNEYSSTPEQRNIFSSTVVLRGVLLSAAVVVVYYLFFPTVMPYLKISAEFLPCFMIMTLYLFIRPLNIIVLNLLRVNEKTLFFNVISFVGKVASVGLSLLLLLYIVKELYGYFIGVVLAEYMVALILGIWFFSRFKVHLKDVSGDLSKRLIVFGAPLLFTELFYLVLSYFDRYMIVYFNGEHALGIYSVGYNLAMYIGNIITFSLNYAVIPIYVKIFEDEGKVKTETFLSDSLNYLMIAIIPICIGFHAVSIDLFVFLASDKYASAAGFSTIILVGTIVLGMNSLLNAGLYLKKKTHYIFIIMGAAVILNITLNYFLLHVYGVKGAALAFLTSSTFAALLTIALSFRYIVIRLNLKSMAYHLGISAVMFIMLTQIETGKPWLNLALKIPAGFVIVAAGVLLKEKQLRSSIMRFIRRNS